MLARLRQALPFVVGLALFMAALEVLRVELRAVSWHEITGDVLRTPASQLAAAIVLTILNYAALTGYDLLAFAYIRKPLPRARIALASFLAYAVANNVGFAMLSGASVRYRFYTRWGVTAEELSRIVFSYSVTFWLGLLLLGGLSLVVSPLPHARELPAHQLLVAAGLVADAACRRRTSWPRSCGGGRSAIRSFELPLPPVRDRDRPGCDLRGRLGACRCGALRAAPAVHRFRSCSSSAFSSSPSCSAWSATFPAASACSRG